MDKFDKETTVETFPSANSLMPTCSGDAMKASLDITMHIKIPLEIIENVDH